MAVGKSDGQALSRKRSYRCSRPEHATAVLRVMDVGRRPRLTQRRRRMSAAGRVQSPRGRPGGWTPFTQWRWLYVRDRPDFWPVENKQAAPWPLAGTRKRRCHGSCVSANLCRSTAGGDEICDAAQARLRAYGCKEKSVD